MRKILIGLAAALLAGCATGYGYSEYGGYGYGDYYYGDAGSYGSGYHDPYYGGYGRTYGGLGYYGGSGYYGSLSGGWGYPWYGGYYPGWYGSPGHHYRPPYRPRPGDVDPPGNRPPSAVSRLRSAEELEQLREQRRLQRDLAGPTLRGGVDQPAPRSRLRGPDGIGRPAAPVRRMEAPQQRLRTPRAAPVENRLRGNGLRSSPGVGSAPRAAVPERVAPTPRTVPGASPSRIVAPATRQLARPAPATPSRIAAPPARQVQRPAAAIASPSRVASPSRAASPTRIAAPARPAPVSRMATPARQAAPRPAAPTRVAPQRVRAASQEER